MSSISIMPFHYILNVALIQIPISKCVADPRNVWMILSVSEIESQTADARELQCRCAQSVRSWHGDP